MKKMLCLVIVLMSGLFAFAGCGNVDEKTSAETVELQVFAASSLTEALTEIGEAYKTVAPDVELVFNFDSSGTLKTQIEGGAEVDVFISAAPKQMNALEEGGYILEDSRFDLLENQVVLIVPEGSVDNITSFEQCAEELSAPNLIAIGNSDVPVGAYTEEIFKHYGLWETVTAKASFGSSAKQVLSQVEQGTVNAGIVYKTDAVTAKGTVVVCAAEEGSHSPVIYPAAILKNSAKQETAQAFLEYLTGAEAAAAFEAVGFVLAK